MQNRHGDSVVICNQSQGFRQVLRSKGSRFELTFTPGETAYYLMHGGEWVKLFLKKDYDLAITFDGQKVLQAIQFEGKRADENNFLAQYDNDLSQFSKASAFYQTSRNYAGWRRVFEARLPELDRQMKALGFEREFIKLMHAREAEADEGYKDVFREIGVLRDQALPIDMKGKPAPPFDYENSQDGSPSCRI